MDTTQPLQDDWMPLAEAAEWMRVHKDTLAKKDASKTFYLYAPAIERRQHVPKGRIWLRRSQVLAWIAEQEARARHQAAIGCNTLPAAPAIGWEPLRGELARIPGSRRTMKALGLG